MKNDNNLLFKDWIKAKQFTQVTEDNKRHYWGIFDIEQMCDNKLCTCCAGYLPTYDSEDDIAAGRIVPIRCPTQLAAIVKTRCERLLKHAKIPVRYQNINASSLTLNPKITNDIRMYLESFPNIEKPNLYLYSDSHNTGKTSMLWIMIKSLLKRNKISCGFILQSTPQFMNNLRKSEFGGDGKNTLLEKACVCDVVVFDDFGRQRQTKGSQDWLFTIIEERVNNCLPTIFSTNYPPDPMEWSTPFEQTIIHRILPTTTFINFEKDNEIKM